VVGLVQDVHITRLLPAGRHNHDALLLVRVHARAGGNILGHYVDTRIYVRKGKGNNRVAKIYAGPYPEVECNFAVSEAGVVDPE